MTNKDWVKARVSIARLLRDKKISLEQANSIAEEINFKNEKESLHLANQKFGLEKYGVVEGDYSMILSDLIKLLSWKNRENPLLDFGKAIQSATDKIEVALKPINR